MKKMKRLLIVLSAFFAMFALSGCGEKKEAPFAYDDTIIVLNTMEYFTQYANVSDDFADYYLEAGTDFEKSAVKGISQARDTDKVGSFFDYSYYNSAIYNGTFDIKDVEAEISEAEDYVTVKIINKASNRDVEITVKYVENADYYISADKAIQEALQYYAQQGITPEQIIAETGSASIAEALGVDEYLQSKGLFPYMPEEMVVSAVYSKAELMGQAGMNTLLGMGTVFAVLIFISFIISLFKFLPALFAKKAKLPEVKEEKKATATPAAPKKDDNLMNDAQLVAVITAAIYAATGSGSAATSKDRLVVRSIKRVR